MRRRSGDSPSDAETGRGCWYFTTERSCVLCGAGETTRERRYDAKPDDPDPDTRKPLDAVPVGGSAPHRWRFRSRSRQRYEAWLRAEIQEIERQASEVWYGGDEDAHDLEGGSLVSAAALLSDETIERVAQVFAGEASKMADAGYLFALTMGDRHLSRQLIEAAIGEARERVG